MTARVNRKGQIVLNSEPGDHTPLKPGDILVVARDRKGSMILKKRNAPPRLAKAYLNPPVLPGSVLERLYQIDDPAWGRVEAEAVAMSRKSLTGRSLAEL